MPWHPALGCALPIVQAPMAGVQDYRLAAAVCQAGGLGSLPAATHTAESLRQELLRLHHALGADGNTPTQQPYNLNFFAHTSPTPDAIRNARWHALLQPYYAQWGLVQDTGPASAGRHPFDAAMADVVQAFRPAVVSFHFGLPAPDLLERVRRSGARIWSSATTVAEARWLADHGADAIIAQGLEAGGHRGMFLSTDLHTQLGTMALLPQVLDAVPIPVIAAGGIGDARAVQAVLSMGACAAQVGTAYLLCPEATTSPLHRTALQQGDTPTALTNLFTGRPARGLVNRLMRELGPLREDIPPFPLCTTALAPLRQAAEPQGCSDFTPLWAGQNTHACQTMAAGLLTRQLGEATKTDGAL
ncbi:nitronate monooxygenase [Curvibacter sp. CHRR-16]|nr:nitronate monooxygenase [Curvibacter sp. CHRR-16]